MHPITLNEARAVMDSALKAARDKDLSPMAVCVLDAGGHMVGYLREDGAPMIRFKIARAKAWSCIARGAGATQLAEQAGRNPVLVSSLQSMLGDYFPVRGGVLLKNAEGAVIGAVGVTGASAAEDEACALAGAAAADLDAVP